MNSRLPALEFVEPCQAGADSPALDELVRGTVALLVDEGATPPSSRSARNRLRHRLGPPRRAVLFRNPANADSLGFCIWRCRAGVLHIEQFRINPGHRRRSWGRACIEALLDTQLEAGMTASVNVLEDNPQAIAFWRALGFGVGTRALAVMARPQSVRLSQGPQQPADLD